MKGDFLFELGTEELPSSAVEKLGNLLLENLCEEFKKPVSYTHLTLPTKA